jgi:nitrogenase molybdenum-iron protein NifN
VFDRIGNAHRCQVGYRGTMALIFEIANLMMEQIGHHHATDWPLTPEALRAATTVKAASSPEFFASTLTPISLAEASA